VSFPHANLDLASKQLHQNMHPVASRLGIGEPLEATPANSLIIFNPARSAHLIGVTAVMHDVTVGENMRLNCADYFILMARSIGGDGYMFSLSWGHQDRMSWNTDLTFSTAAGFRRAYAKMREERYYEVRRATFTPRTSINYSPTKLVLVGERPPLRLRVELDPTGDIGA
jgi:hypothetical protein